MSDETLTPADLPSLNLTGHPFLQEQGWSLTRGRVASLTLDDTHWEMAVTDVEYFDSSKQQWVAEGDDTYGSALHEAWSSFSRDTDTDIISFGGYGMVVHVGPECEDPWSDIPWPDTDIEPTGLCLASRLSRRDRKRLRTKQRKPRNRG